MSEYEFSLPILQQNNTKLIIKIQNKPNIFHRTLDVQVKTYTKKIVFIKQMNIWNETIIESNHLELLRGSEIHSLFFMNPLRPKTQIE